MKDLGLLYSYKGILVNFQVEEDKLGSNLYHFIIPYKYAEVYLKEIGSDDKDKLESLNGMVEYINRSDSHNKAEYIDKIPMLGEVIARCGKDLKLFLWGVCAHHLIERGARAH